LHLSEAGSGRNGAAREPSQRRSGGVRSLVISDVATFHDSDQVPLRADDERSVNMVIVEEVSYLPDGGGQRMSRGDREHRIGRGGQTLSHLPRVVRTIDALTSISTHRARPVQRAWAFAG
jgi:hypothetical protein